MKSRHTTMADGISNRCPVTGLAILRKPEWDIDFGEDKYRATFAKLGDHILKIDLFGFSSLRANRKTADSIDAILANHFNLNKGFVQIFDMKQNTGYSRASRFNFLKASGKRKGLLGHIFYNTSTLFNIGLRLTRKLVQTDFGIHIVNNYQEAVQLAEKLIESNIGKNLQFQVDTTIKPFTAFEAREYCHATGLPIREKPAWTDVDFGGGYTATFKIIGKHILLCDPRGRAGYREFEKFFDMRKKVILEVFGRNTPFFEIKDYRTTRTPPKAMRKLFIDRMFEEENQIIGFIAYNAPVGVRFSLNVGKRLIKSPCPVNVVPGYEQAVRMAITAIEYYERTGRFPPRLFFSSQHMEHGTGQTYTPYQMDHFVNELLQFLVNINWEIEGLGGSMMKIPDNHPFSLVYEAMALIKTDLDNLYKERRNAVKALLKTQEQLIQSEKMAALGSLVAGVSHEISTPLGIGLTASSFLRQKTATLTKKMQLGPLAEKDMDAFIGMAVESSSMIEKNLIRASELIKSFKQISVDQSNEMKRSFHLKEYTRDILQSLAPGLKKNEYHVHLDCPDHIRVETYPGALSQVLTNLVMNSIIHGFEGRKKGEINIWMWEIPGSLSIEYRDNGKGMDEKALKQMFDPFFTTRRSSGGTGLGMHIVYNIVTAKLRGEITCSSSPGEGAMFLIQLPH